MKAFDFHACGIIAAAIVAAMALAPAQAQAPQAQAPQAQAPETAPPHLVTYIVVTPSAEAATATLLRELAAASRKEAGNQRFDVLQETERHNQFGILEVWSDAKAHEAHAGGSAMKQFRTALDPLRIGYYDERLDTNIDMAPVAEPAGKDAIYVATHVDVTGPFKDDAIVMMKTLAAASRKEAGAQRFEIWQQDNRLNHFTMVETWKDQASLDAHNMAAPARTFREQVGRMMGALYDDRHYRNLE